MSLHASFAAHRDRFRLRVDLDLAPGEVVVIAGPNGAGKSTLLAAIAGQVRIDSGEIVLDDRLLARGRGLHVPAHRRGIAMLAQSPTLFGHLDVRDNVGYGLRAGGVRRRAARLRAQTLLAAAGLDHLARRRPDRLSGGQAARVALLRALIVDPALLLLDEPFAALDAATVLDVRTALTQSMRTETTRRPHRASLIVSHDPADALLLGDRLVLIEGGRITHQGSPTAVLAAPRSEFGHRYAAGAFIPG
ncbi:MAG: ABC transporter ATP-binding protein [Mycobacteriales bacterium]